jgi:hypothetical protein
MDILNVAHEHSGHVCVHAKCLQNELPDLLEKLPLLIWLQMLYQHIVVSLSDSRNITAYLNERFPGRWIGRNSTLNWPPRSPDLSLIDCHVWCSMIAWCMKARGKLFRRISDWAQDTLISLQFSIRLQVHQWNKPDCASNVTTDISNNHFKLSKFYGLTFYPPPH